MVADLCQLQFVVFSFCRGEKTTIIGLAFCRLFEAKRQQVDKTPSKKTTSQVAN
jgi:hypothetical protein